MVAGLCHALLRDRGEAEDAAQQVFLSAHRALLGGAEPREPAAWLAAITRNECWQRISSRMRTPLAVDGTDEVPGGADPVDEALRRADLAALWRAIRMLPSQQRDALLLREFGGLRYDELAVALGVSEPAVESLLFRARSRLRSQLKAAYAGITGASWIEAAARLLAGAGAPAAATKAVAVGLSAAAVTGGAAVAPKMLEHHSERRVPTPQRTTVTRSRPTTVVPVAAVVAPQQVEHATAAAESATASHRGRRRRGGDDGTSHEGSTRTVSTPSAEPREDNSGPGSADDRPATTPATSPVTSPVTTTVQEPVLAVEDSGGSSHEGPGGGGDGGGGGHGGSGGEDGGSSHSGSGG